MKTPVWQSTTARRRRFVRRGFTLVELVTSMTIMVILMGATTSVILVASHAMPGSGDPAQTKVAAMDVVDQIAGELFYATSITEETETAVTFTVADRGHGAAGPETIRYEWSGTPGDPLTRQYNGGTVVTVCADVQSLQLSYDKRVGRLDGPPSVLLIVLEDAALNAQDEARRQQIQSWGSTVQVTDPYRSDAEYAADLDTADVMYWSEEHAAPPPWWVFDAGRGIVCEKRDSFGVLGISQNSNWQWYRNLQIVDNTHEITSPFALGALQIFSSDQYGVISTGTIAPDGKLLGMNSGYKIMVAVDVDGALYGGKKARARRVSMPWGDRDFDFNSVTEDGLTLMRRAIVWAAAPIQYTGVRIVLEPARSGEPLRTEVQVFNTPKVNPQ